MKTLIMIFCLLMPMGAFAAGCTEWSGGAQSYSVGQHVTYNGKFYKCIRAVDSWTAPDNSWFWEVAPSCGTVTGSAPIDITCTGSIVYQTDTVGTVIGALDAIDPDEADTSTFIIADTTVFDNRYVSIAGDILTLKRSLASLTKDSLTVEITATDSHGLKLKKKVSLVVAIDPEKEIYAHWTHSFPVSLNTSASGTKLDTTLASVITLIDFKKIGFPFERATATGADIRFATPTGTKIPFELVQWDSADGRGAAWVKIPVLMSNTPNQTIICYTGNSNAKTPVWKTPIFVDNFHVVVDGSRLKDRTIFNRGGLLVNFRDTITTDTIGAVANGLKFGSTNKPLILDFDSSQHVKMLSFMVKPDSLVQPGALAQLRLSTGRSVTLSIDSLGKAILSIDSSSFRNDSVIVTPNTWTHLVIGLSDSTIELYRDGKSIGRQSFIVGGAKLIKTITVGASVVNGVVSLPFKGHVDELRVGSESFDPQLFPFCSNLDRGAYVVAPVSGSMTAPSNFTATPKAGGVLLSWKDNSKSETGFDLMYGLKNVSGFQFLATVDSNQTSFFHPITKCGEEVQYRLKAFNATEESPVVTAVGATMRCQPSAVVVTNVESDQVMVNWNSLDSGVTVQLQFRSSDSTMWNTIFSGSAESFVHQGVACKQPLQYRIKEVSAVSESDWSDVTDTISGECAMNAPTNLQGSIDPNGYVELTWSDNSTEELGFYIYRKNPSASVFSKIDSVYPDVKKYVDATTGCTNAKYTYYVKGFGFSGNSGASNSVLVQTEFCGSNKSSFELLSLVQIVQDSTRAIVNSDVDLQVTLYNSEFEGSAIYTEMLNKVPVRNSFAQLVIGQKGGLIDVIKNQKSLWYDVTWKGKSLNQNKRQPLCSVPYTIKNQFSLHGTSAPVNVVAPVGATYVDSSNKQLYFKVGVANSDWIMVR